MPLLRKPVLLPIVGLDYMNPSTMINDRGGFPKNMRLYRNYLKKREGKSAFGETEISGGQIMHLCQYELESLVVRAIRFSKTRAQKYNATTGVWDDITGTPFTGGDSDFFSTCVAENKLIIANYIDATRTYNDSGNTANLAAVDGEVPKAKFIEYNEAGYLIAAFVNVAGVSYPTKVMWSDIGNIAKWGSGNYGASLLRHNPTPIRGLRNLNEYTVAYKKDGIYLGRPVDTTDIIKWDLVHTGVGLLASRALVDHRGKHYFMGLDDFYSFTGDRPESIADQTIQRECFSRIDEDKSDRNFALVMTEYDEVWFFVVVSGNSWPTEIWKYNYRTGFWYYDTCSELTAAMIYYQQASVAVDDLVGTIDQQMFRIDDKLLTTNFPFGIVGNSDGFTYKLDAFLSNDVGVAIDAEWASMDFAADKFEEYKRWLQLDFEAKGHSLKVYYSTDFGKTYTLIKNQTLTNEWATYRIYFDKVAQYIRFKFRNDSSGETFYLRHFYPYYLSREEVNK